MRPNIKDFKEIVDYEAAVNEYIDKLEKKLKLYHKAITAIEGLTFEDLIMEDSQRLSEIYKYAHIAHGTCLNNHEDWHHELDVCLVALEKLGITALGHTKKDNIKLQERWKTNEAAREALEGKPYKSDMVKGGWEDK